MLEHSFDSKSFVLINNFIQEDGYCLTEDGSNFILNRLDGVEKNNIVTIGE